MRRCCAIIPAYNTAGTIAPLVMQIRQLSVDTIVVNDGSTDQTARVAADAGALVINLLTNQGKGLALRTGFTFARQANYDAIVTLDSDGQHDPAEIPRLLAASHQAGADIVIGQRCVQGSVMPLVRQWTNHVMSTMISWLAKQPIPDSQCGFRVIQRRVLDGLSLSSRRFDLESEFLLTATRLGWTVTSVPIRTIYQNHRSHIRPLTDGLRFLWLVLRHVASSRPVAPRRLPMSDRA